MIERYSRPQMTELWSDRARLDAWLEVELAVCEVLTERGVIPAADMEVIREKAACDPVRIAEIEEREGKKPRLVATSAKGGPDRRSYADEVAQLRDKARPTLLLFGTGHGLSPSVLQRCDTILAPIEGPTEFNHLSVRAAVAITLDRLLGAK